VENNCIKSVSLILLCLLKKKEGKTKHFVSRASTKRIPILLVVFHLKLALVNALHLKENFHCAYKGTEFLFVKFEALFTHIFSEELHFAFMFLTVFFY
jgi:hypothetical protein